MPDLVIINITGQDMQSLLDTNERKYKPNVTYENRKRVILLHLIKAMYKSLKAVLLKYQLFAETLKQNDFVLNPYEPCVANKTVHEKAISSSLGQCSTNGTAHETIIKYY